MLLILSSAINVFIWLLFAFVQSKAVLSILELSSGSQGVILYLLIPYVGLLLSIGVALKAIFGRNTRPILVRVAIWFNAGMISIGALFLVVANASRSG